MARSVSVVHRPRRVRARVLITAIVLICLGAGSAAAVAVTSAQAAPATVGTIDGVAVSRDELIFHMQRLLPIVQNELGLTSTDPAVWDRPGSDAHTPVDALRDAALNEIEQDRSVFALAQEHDLVSYVDFAGFQADLTHTNKERADQSATGGAVYGSVSFTADEFYSRTVSNLKAGLVSALVHTGDIVVTDADVSTYLDAHASDWSANAATYSLTRIAVPLMADAADLSTAIRDDGGVDTFAAEHPDAAVSSTILDSGTGTFADGRTASPRFIADLPQLTVGDLTDEVTEEGHTVVYRFDSVNVDREHATALYGQKITALLQQQALDALLADHTDTQERSYDNAALATITMKDITS